MEAGRHSHSHRWRIAGIRIYAGPDRAASRRVHLLIMLIFGSGSASISPDGKFLAFVKPWNGTLNVWVKRREEPFDAARVLTAELLRPVADYLWTRDGKYVIYVKDKDGDENFNVYAVDPAASPAT